MRGVQHYVIKFVSDLRQVGGSFRILRFPPPLHNKTDRHDIAEILLKVALNTIKQTNKHTCICILNSSYIQCERNLDFNSDVDSPRFLCRLTALIILL